MYSISIYKYIYKYEYRIHGTQFMVPIQNVKMTVGPIWNTGGTETEIIVPVSVLGPERVGTEMGSDRFADAQQVL